MLEVPGLLPRVEQRDADVCMALVMKLPTGPLVHARLSNWSLEGGAPSDVGILQKQT